MVSPKIIASNTTWYIIALASQKVVSFVYFTLLARYLGPHDTGKYFFAVTLTVLFSVLTDIGMSAVLTREVAKFKEESNRLLSQVVTLKILTSLIVIGLLAVVAPFITSDPITIKLIVIASAAMILDGFTLIFYSAIRGKQNLFYESVATILHQVIVLAVGIILIKREAPVEWLAYALLIASVFNFIWSWIAAQVKLQFSIKILWDKALLKSLYLIMIPFALAAIFTRIYAYVDTVLLQLMKGDEAVGLYAIAYKITFAFQFLPLAFIAALYPAFSYYWQHDKDMLYVTASKSMQYLLLISLPISVGIITLAPEIVPRLYTSDFGNSVTPLQVLILTLPFLFLNFPLGSLLNACSKQKWQTIILAVGMITNIIMNVLLIPILGPTGAATASTASTFIVFIISIIAVKKVAPFDHKLVIGTAYKTTILSLVMAAVIVFLLQSVLWYWTLIPAVTVYILGLWLLRLLSAEDIASFKKSLLRR